MFHVILVVTSQHPGYPGLVRVNPRNALRTKNSLF